MIYDFVSKWRFEIARVFEMIYDCHFEMTAQNFRQQDYFGQRASWKFADEKYIPGPYGLIHGCERRKRHERECRYFDHRRSAKAERGTVQKMLRKMGTNACALRQLPESSVLPCGSSVGECGKESCVRRCGCRAVNRHQKTSANAQERSHNYGY